MKLRGRLIPVMVEIMPGILVNRNDCPNLPQRRLRSWQPRIRKRPKKK